MLVCLRPGVLRLRPQPVAAGVVTALSPGLAVLSGLAVATRCGSVGHPAGLLGWLQMGCLPGRGGRVGARAS